VPADLVGGAVHRISRVPGAAMLVVDATAAGPWIIECPEGIRAASTQRRRQRTGSVSAEDSTPLVPAELSRCPAPCRDDLRSRAVRSGGAARTTGRRHRSLPPLRAHGRRPCPTSASRPGTVARAPAGSTRAAATRREGSSAPTSPVSRSPPARCGVPFRSPWQVSPKPRLAARRAHPVTYLCKVQPPRPSADRQLRCTAAVASRARPPGKGR